MAEIVKPIDSTVPVTPLLGQSIAPQNTSTIEPIKSTPTLPEIKPIPTVTPAIAETKPAVPEKLPEVTPTAPTPAISPTSITPAKDMPTAVLGAAETKIAAGDTFYTIAQKNNTTVDAIQKANPGIDPNKLQVGQTIKLMETPTAPTAPAPSTAPALGSLSAKYESSGDPGAVSTGSGDPGGKSYGTYQLASKMGTVNTFLNYLKTANPSMYNTLNTAYNTGGAGFGANFDAAWKSLAAKDPIGFEKVQHDFIQAQYYTPAADQLKTAGLDVSKYSVALQNALWSTAVQFGVGGATSIFKEAMGAGDESAIINKIYDIKTRKIQAQTTLSADVQKGVVNRFVQERADALAMLAKYPAETTAAPAQTPTSPIQQAQTPTSLQTAPEPALTTEGKTTIPVAPLPTSITLKGDETLYALAQNYGTTVDELTKLNPGVNPQNLQAGQKINVPTKSITTPAPSATTQFTPTIKNLGTLSEQYESNGQPGAISYDPAGGGSYGLYQIVTFTNKDGTNAGMGTPDGSPMAAFIKQLGTSSPDIAKTLNDAKAKDGGKFGTNFETAWKSLAAKDPTGFSNAQWNFIKETHFQPVYNDLIAKGVSSEKLTPLIQNILWSTSVLTGGGAVKVGVFDKVDWNADEDTIIRQIFQGRADHIMKFDATKYADPAAEKRRREGIVKARFDETNPNSEISRALGQSLIASGKAVEVKSGDTLSKIAQANNTTVAALQKANPTLDINNMQAGQVVKLAPVTAPAPVPTPTTAPTVAPSPVPTPESTGIPPVLQQATTPTPTSAPVPVPTPAPAKEAAVAPTAGIPPVLAQETAPAPAKEQAPTMDSEIKPLGEAYETAKASNDSAGMIDAMQKADAIRTKYGQPAQNTEQIKALQDKMSAEAATATPMTKETQSDMNAAIKTYSGMYENSKLNNDYAGMISAMQAADEIRVRYGQPVQNTEQIKALQAQIAAATTPTPAPAPTPTAEGLTEPTFEPTPTPTSTEGVPPVLQEQAPSPVSTTGLPAGWNAEDYSADYQAEIDRITALNPNDPRLPILQAKRAEKVAGMTPEQLTQAGITSTGEPAPPPPPAPFDVSQYSDDYQAEIDKRMAVNPNDPAIPQLQAARVQKITAMAAEPVSTRTLQQVDEVPAGQVPLAAELKKQGVDVTWDGATGQIKLNGQTITNGELQGATLHEGSTYVSHETLDALIQKYKTPEVPKEPTPVMQRDGGTKTYTNETNGKPWNIDDYANDYEAEFNRILSMNPGDPRLDLIDKVRADKVLANPEAYPDLVQWATDIKNGTWKAEDYKNNYQGEINRLRAINPADPRINTLEHLRAAKILANPGLVTKAERDWAVSKDKEGWKASNYSADYQAEIERIRQFNPNDPRIQELSDLRALKILANPGGYDEATVKEARAYQAMRGDQMQQIESNRAYTEAEVQADMETQKAIKRINEYYKKAGLSVGGQAAADIRQAALAGQATIEGLERDRMKALTDLILQQSDAKAKQKLAEAQYATEAAKTDAEIQQANIALQKAQLGYQESQIALQKAGIGLQQDQIGLQTAQVGLQHAQTTAGAAAAAASRAASTASSKGASQDYYDSMLVYYDGKKEGNWWDLGEIDKVTNAAELTKEVNANPDLSAAQKRQMLMDLGIA